MQHHLEQTHAIQAQTVRLADRVEGFRLEDKRLKDVRGQRRQLEAFKNDFLKAEKRLRTAGSQAGQITDLLDKTRLEHENAEKAWIEGPGRSAGQFTDPGPALSGLRFHGSPRPGLFPDHCAG